MEVAMLERFFLKPQTVDRIMGCWLGPRIELYVTALCERGYAARSILRRVPILMEFAEFAAARNADRVERAETLLDAFVVDWLSARRLDRPADARRRDRNLARGTVRHFFSLVVSKCEHRPEKAAWANPFTGQVPEFFEYLREERGLRPSSIHHYRHYLRRFELYLDQVGCCDLGVLALPVDGTGVRFPGDGVSGQHAAGFPSICAPGRRSTPRPHQADRGAATLSDGGYPAVDRLGCRPEDARPGRATHSRRTARLRHAAAHGHVRAACPRGCCFDARRPRLEA